MCVHLKFGTQLELIDIAFTWFSILCLNWCIFIEFSLHFCIEFRWIVVIITNQKSCSNHSATRGDHWLCQCSLGFHQFCDCSRLFADGIDSTGCQYMQLKQESLSVI